MTTCDLPDVEEWGEEMADEDVGRRYSLEEQILLQNG